MSKIFNNSSRIIYTTYNNLSSSGTNDSKLISELLEILKDNKFGNNFTLNTLLSNFENQGAIDHIGIIELIGLAHQKSKEKNIISHTDERKHNGIYYTSYIIAKKISEDSVYLFKDKFDPIKQTFLEPCAGIGIFAIAYLDTIFQSNKKYISQAQKIVNNLYFADIDNDAIALLRKIIPIYLKSKYSVATIIPPKNIYIGNALFNLESGIVKKNDLKSVFGCKEGFDIVLTNPPYKLLKANSNKYSEKTDNYKEEVNKTLDYIKKNDVYPYNSGTLNLYKLFIEEIVENLTHNKSKIGLLIPSTLLSDKQSYGLRNRILENYSFFTIYTLPERNNFFLDICQSFCFFALDKGVKDADIRIKINIGDHKDIHGPAIKLNKSSITAISSQKEIVSTDQIGWKILNKIHKHQKLFEISSIKNLRGELDLTIDKQFLTPEFTEYSLLRGNGIKEFKYKRDSYYVQHVFIDQIRSKAQFLNSERIVCQQVSNINLLKRLKFTKIPKNIVLGNSCNFIATNQNGLFNESNVTLDFLLGILNSFLLNWRFQLTSSNNHIGNYELAELPIVLPNDKQKVAIEDIVKKLNSNPDNLELKARLNSEVFELYGLDKNEASYILSKHQEDEVAIFTKKLYNYL